MSKKFSIKVLVLLVFLLPSITVAVSAQEIGYDLDAFSNPNYNKTSSIPLSVEERTATYVYPESPCGTLVTEFSSPGSVRVGNGPVYTIALQATAYANATPDVNSFRVYSCKNFSSGGVILGKVTFAFKVLPIGNANVSSVMITKPISQMTQAEKDVLIKQIRVLLLQLIEQLNVMVRQGAV